MITKESLINRLNEALKTEESAIPLYTKHISSTLFLAEIEKERVAKIKEILDVLNAETRKHARMFKLLINRIGRETKDVY